MYMQPNVTNPAIKKKEKKITMFLLLVFHRKQFFYILGLNQPLYIICFKNLKNLIMLIYN